MILFDIRTKIGGPHIRKRRDDKIESFPPTTNVKEVGGRGIKCPGNHEHITCDLEKFKLWQDIIASELAQTRADDEDSPDPAGTFPSTSTSKPFPGFQEDPNLKNK